ncbi:MAG: hypothetical protein K2N05_08025 [Muribaculaceae bacterium]|nr:hypothetical protein [Muribaculaceae bacterium]
MIAILKAMLVLIILVAMVMILIGINKLFTGEILMEEEATDCLRNDVKEKAEVMTSQNIFRRFLGR